MDAHDAIPAQQTCIVDMPGSLALLVVVLPYILSMSNPKQTTYGHLDITKRSTGTLATLLSAAVIPECGCTREAVIVWHTSSKATMDRFLVVPMASTCCNVVLSEIDQVLSR